MKSRNEIKLNREFQLLLLNILKKGSITVNEVTQINKLSGFELSESINSYAYLSDTELDLKIAELQKKIYQ